MRVYLRVMTLEDFAALGLLTEVNTEAWEKVVTAGAVQARPWEFDNEDADLIRAVLGRRPRQREGAG